MEQERWQDIKQAFHGAIALSAAGREDFLAGLFGQDASIAAEVRALLAAHDRGNCFLETPAAQTLEVASPKADALPRGIGPWRIRNKIGRGGMADVYLAERSDGQFRKRAAVKVLQSGLFGDEVRTRFARERQVLADLDHPNIVRLIDGGVTEDNRPYLVMDFVDGTRITDFAVQHALSREARLKIFLEVCDAVGYAHQKGIIHRDLKPANILVASEGIPKLLDFGIAKLLQQAPGSAGSTATRIRCFTPEYASPEQIRGQPVSPSSDLYSLGLVLFHLLSDRPAFQLDRLNPLDADQTACERTPDTSSFPRRLARIVDKATRKPPEQRYASAGEFAAAIRRYLDAPGSAISTRSLQLTISCSALAAVAAGILLIAPRVQRQIAPKKTPKESIQRLTAYPGFEGHPNLSPDGGMVVFERRGGGIRGLWIHGIVTGADNQLTDGADFWPKWSPDRNMIAFARRVDAGVYDVLLINPLGGPVRKVVQAHGNSVSWAPDSQTLAFVDRSSPQEPPSVFLIALDGGNRRRLSFPPPHSMGDSVCAFSPDGKTVAVIRYATAGNGDIYLVPVTDGKERRLTSGEGWINGVTWTPGGDEVVFASTRAKAGNQAGIWRVSAVEGRPADPRLASIGTFPRNLPVNPALAGNRLVFEGENFRSTVWKMPLRGGASLPVRVFGSGHGEETPTYSPDGKRLAFFYSRRGDGHHDIATANIDGSHLEQITTQGLLFTRRPSWSPDGSKVAYNANVGGRRCLFVVPSAGGEGRRMPIGDFDAGRPSWSHDGRWIYFSCDRSGSLQIWKIPADGSREPIQITRGGGVEAIESSTGGLLYFLRSDDSGKVFTVPALGGREEPLEGSPIIHAGYWSYARNQIYFFNLGQDRTGLDRFPVQRFHPVTQRLETVGWIEGSDLLVPEISVRADGKEVLWCKRDLGADLFMLENFR